MPVASLPVTRFEWNIESDKIDEEVENPLVTMVTADLEFWLYFLVTYFFIFILPVSVFLLSLFSRLQIKLGLFYTDFRQKKSDINIMQLQTVSKEFVFPLLARERQRNCLKISFHQCRI
jgi:hypothetical protein